MMYLEEDGKKMGIWGWGWGRDQGKEIVTFCGSNIPKNQTADVLLFEN